MRAEHPRRGGERLQQPPLGRRQVDLVLAAPHGSRAQVDPDVVDLEPGAARLGRRPAQERPYPGQELRGAERLRQVVVGAEVERGDLVLLGVAHRQHEDRHRAEPPDLPAGGEPVDVRQVEVEHDEVGLAVADRADRGAPVGRRRDAEVAGEQRPLHRAEDLGLVVDDEDRRVAHARREPEPDRRAAARGVGRPDLAAHRGDEALADRETEPGTQARRPFLQPVERREQQLLVAEREAGPVVDHLHDDHAVRPLRGELDPPVGGAPHGARRVLHEVGDDPLHEQLRRPGRGRRRRRPARRSRRPASARARRRPPDRRDRPDRRGRRGPRACPTRSGTCRAGS